MKKLFIMLSVMLLTGFIFAEEQTGEEPQFQNAEEVKENAEAAQTDLKKETEPQKEEDKKEEAAPVKEEKPIFLEEKKDELPQRNYEAGFELEKKELTKKWYFLPINLSIGTSLQVGLTVAQFTHKNFEIRIANFMLGPGFRFGSSVKNDDDDGFIPGLAFLGEVSFGKFFGNPLKENCFGIILGVGSKVVFDIRKVDEEDEWNDGISLDDTLYVDFLPVYLTYRWHKGDKFYDISLRIPLVWQNGVYKMSDETRLYNGVPDMTLNFSFIF